MDHIFGFLRFFNIFALIILGIFQNRIDKTDRLGLPPIPSQLTVWNAYLRGKQRITRSVLFSLMQKGYLQMENDGKRAEFTELKLYLLATI